MGTLVLKEDDLWTAYLEGYSRARMTANDADRDRENLERLTAYAIGVEHRIQQHVLSRIGEVPPLVTWLLTRPPEMAGPAEPDRKPLPEPSDEIEFEYEGVEYRVSAAALHATKRAYLPDGLVIEVLTWSETEPPMPRSLRRAADQSTPRASQAATAVRVTAG